MEYVYIHIGKTGGGTLKPLLESNGLVSRENFIHGQCRLNNFIKKKNNKTKYIITIRDPVSRFISAFNWKKYRLTNFEILDMFPKSNENDIKKLRKEKELYLYWNNINNFAENLYHEDSKTINKKALELINISNHLHENISFYLKDIINDLNKENCLIIELNNFKTDIKNKLNLIVEKNKNYNPEKDLYISIKGRNNLEKFLESDFRYYNKLLIINSQ